MRPWPTNLPLDFLVCGLPINCLDPERPYGQLRGNATRAFGLANNFSRQGWRVGLVVEPTCRRADSAWIHEELTLVHRADLAATAAHAQVLLLASTNLMTLREHVPEALAVPHPRKWLATCFDYNDDALLPGLLQGVVGVSLNNEIVADSWRRRNLDLPLHVVPYGVDENGYVDASIGAAPRPNAVWIAVPCACPEAWDVWCASRKSIRNARSGWWPARSSTKPARGAPKGPSISPTSTTAKAPCPMNDSRRSSASGVIDPRPPTCATSAPAAAKTPNSSEPPPSPSPSPAAKASAMTTQRSWTTSAVGSPSWPTRVNPPIVSSAKPTTAS